MGGMMQLTPYPGNIFQLHGMTKDITLFSDGLAKSSINNSQPELGEKFETKIHQGWNEEETCSRTKKAINHAAKFIPTFSTAYVSGPPLFGAQQIPGKDPSLRAASVSFPAERYARVEIVKGSSALAASDGILQNLNDSSLLDLGSKMLNSPREESFRTLLSIDLEEVVERAEDFARHRNWPVGNISDISRTSHSGKYLTLFNHNTVQDIILNSIKANPAILNIIQYFSSYIYNIPRTFIPLFLRSNA